MPVEVIAIVLAGLVTFILRGFFIQFLAGKTLPLIIRLGLNHVPTAVLAALSIPLFFNPAFPVHEPSLVLGIILITIAFAIKTKNLLVSIAVPFSLIIVYQYALSA